MIKMGVLNMGLGKLLFFDEMGIFFPFLGISHLNIKRKTLQASRTAQDYLFESGLILL